MVQWHGCNLVYSQLCTSGCGSGPVHTSSHQHLGSHDEDPTRVSACESSAGRRRLTNIWRMLLISLQELVPVSLCPRRNSRCPAKVLAVRETGQALLHGLPFSSGLKRSCKQVWSLQRQGRKWIALASRKRESDGSGSARRTQ